MAECPIQIRADESRSPLDQTPLLENRQENDNETTLDKTLLQLELFLTILGFNQTTVLSFVLSWGFLLLIGISLPVVILELSNCPGCEKGQIKTFEIDIVISQACLAAASLVCVSHNLRKYGIRKFLFVDRYSGHVERFGDQYIQKISVSSIVQVIGIILCLNAAAKISHRAQAVGARASRWHALMTCSATDSSLLRTSNSMGNLNAANMSGSLCMNYSESDLDSLDFVVGPTNTQLASYMSSYHKRLALVMYLQSNPGGITIFGWTVDRGLINTIFFIELSLVTFVLGKTIIDPS
ncbi:uncharacterized protein LOC111378368 isoform X2 [Olea europaea var. sylvestris]|uniref:uncharacterized protein LOC111378368 isoform X2 n=1 Tax=Olea europaea var. sylvestris TaxID=158386 RepID=UPI000C1CFF99|nr:uncharacterized protein LOC111378368 isoform X2 [Olea europaea var. sylvestris]